MAATGSPYSWLLSGKPEDKPLYIRQSLGLAIEMRADFHMDFCMNKRVLFQMKGACVELRPDAMKVYLRGEVERFPSRGMQVHVYFSLRIDHKDLPCDFMAEVVGAERQGQDRFLLLTLPTDMGHNQRRYNVRIPVGKADIGNFRIWYGAQGDSQAGGKAAQVRWVPIPPEHVEMLDISAGGMHFGLSTASPVMPYLSKRDLFLVSGEFPIKGKASFPITMVGSSVRVAQEEFRPWTRIGINFRRWAHVKPSGIIWLTLGAEDGIPPLGSWVFQTILDRYRIERDGPARAAPEPAVTKKPG